MPGSACANMGFINLSSFRSQDQTFDEDKPKSKEVTRTESIESVQHEYEIEHKFAPGTTRDADLPNIAAAEVAKHDGQGSKRLCTYLSDRIAAIIIASSHCVFLGCRNFLTVLSRDRRQRNRSGRDRVC